MDYASEALALHPLIPRDQPRHSWFGQQDQYRVKIRRFSDCPAEFTVQLRSFAPDADRYLSAYHRGASSVPLPRRSRKPSDEPRDEESIERSQRRAKTKLRLLVTELAPDHFLTFTTRELGDRPYLTPDDWRRMWSYFCRLCRLAGIEFEYVAVLERHPSNPQHLHLHVALRGHVHYKTLHRLWHVAILAQRGQRYTRALRGADAPGHVQDRPVKAPRGSYKAIRKIARYMAKYLTKDLIAEFNKKRYWPSKGISLQDAQVYWLDALSMSDAIREACRMLGQWDDITDKPAQRLFNPSDRVAWCAIEPERSPPPPF